MTEADSKNTPAISTAQTDPREDGTQLRPGLWETINERYPGSMIRKDSYVPLAQLGKPLAEARLTLISSCGVRARNDRPLDVCHPFGDFRFRRAPSQLRHEDLIIHQLKYPHDDADVDINVIFPKGFRNWRPKEFWAALRTISSASSAIAWTRRSSSGPLPATSLRPSCPRKKLMWRCWRPLDLSAISPWD
jgi:hypothetical protein